MKKVFVLLSVVFIFNSYGTFAKKVELADARLAGKNFFFERMNTHEAVSYHNLSITSEFIEKQGNEPVYYIFNVNENGFIIVSAEDACYPVLGYSFSGAYFPDNQPENFRAWMKHYTEEISLVRGGNYPADEAIAAKWNYLSQKNFENHRNPETILSVAPLIRSSWNQDYPYNALCPADPQSGGSYAGHVPVGCTATAMVQIMFYWRWPDMGIGSHCDTYPYGGQQYCADFGSTTYEWDGMPNGTSSECMPLSILSYHAGVSVNMQYGVDGSGAAISDVPYALITNFKYANGIQYVKKSNYNTTSWASLMKTEIDAGRPIEYAGFEPANAGGHAFVCDGYEGNGTYTDYFHFNWGWAGSYDGNFYLSNLNPGSYTFNINQQAVIKIQPNPAYYPEYCSGNHDVTDFNFGTLEDGSGPLANYQTSSNCSWLIGVDDSIQSVALTFLRFDTKTGDEVKIYNGSDATAPLLGSYSGTTLPPAITTTSSQMFITFNSSSSGSAQGFLATYTNIPVSFCNANENLTAASGNISDGSGRFDYRNNTTCKWRILPENATSVTLTFDAFNTEADNDKLIVVDLGPPAVVLQTISGDHSSQLPDPITASSGKMMLMWNTNKDIRSLGWSANYTITVGTPESESFKELSVYPNPAIDKLNIRFAIEAAQQIKIEILSITGEKCLSEVLPYFKGEYSRSIDISKFTQGIYLLRLTSDHGITIRKVIVQ